MTMAERYQNVRKAILRNLAREEPWPDFEIAELHGVSPATVCAMREEIQKQWDKEAKKSKPKGD